MSDKVVTVKMITGVYGVYYSYQPGDILNLEERIAKAWIKEGICEKAPEGSVPRWGPGAGQSPVVGSAR